MTVTELICQLMRLDQEADVFLGPAVEHLAVVEQAGGHRDVPHYIILLAAKDIVG